MANLWLTNRGKYLQVTGDGFVASASDMYVGWIDASTVPAAIDTEAEIQDLDTVAALLALTGIDEPSAAGYARQQITGVTVTEDDANNRVNVDADNVAFGTIATGANLRCGFICKGNDGDDSNNELWGVFVLDANTPTNGASVTLTISDILRAS